jgi:hypothetical protein
MPKQKQAPELKFQKHIVTGIETQIATLTAYRKSLIHECVTGQRRIGGWEIALRRTTPKNMATAGKISGTVIQALRYIGKDRLTPAHRQTLMRRLSAADKRQLLKDRLNTPGWMRPLLAEIAGEGEA